MSTVPTFSVIRSSTGSLSLSSNQLSNKKEAIRRPFQHKFTFKCDSTDSEIYVMAAEQIAERAWYFNRSSNKGIPSKVDCKIVRIFCVFKQARTVKQKLRMESETEARA